MPCMSMVCSASDVELAVQSIFKGKHATASRSLHGVLRMTETNIQTYFGSSFLIRMRRLCDLKPVQFEIKRFCN